jgi:repressor LexA
LNKLTDRQKQILDFIEDYIKTRHYPPTRTDISAKFGFRSPNAAESHLRALAAKGAIFLQAGVSRGIVIRYAGVSGISQQNRLLLVGHVAAGSPILAEENITGSLAVHPETFSPRPHYLLKVRGDSMQNAGIFDGDLLAVHKTSLARNRQIVVARIDGEVTVKRYFRDGNMISLQAENDSYPLLKIDLKHQDFAIEGLGVGVIRQDLTSNHLTHTQASRRQ